MLKRRLQIKNSLTGDCKLLLASGHYRTIHHITPADYLINKEGKPIKVKEVRFAGRKQIINIHTEAWHEPIIVSEDQKIITSDDDKIIIPSGNIIQWTGLTVNNEISFTYEYGFVLGLLVLAGMISEKNMMLLVKTDTQLTAVKHLNRCLSSVICIRDIEIMEGKCLIKYKIDKQSIPSTILNIVANKTLDDDILNPTRKDYVKGIKHGISFALKYTDKLGKPYSMEYINMLCNWINIVYSENDDNKHIKYYLEKFSIRDRVWDVILANSHETFIVNNLLCVSQDIEI